MRTPNIGNAGELWILNTNVSRMAEQARVRGTMVRMAHRSLFRTFEKSGLPHSQARKLKLRRVSPDNK